jgi:hypothetical protein
VPFHYPAPPYDADLELAASAPEPAAAH